MGRQSILPSWQWAKTGTAPVTAGFDFDDAYYGGTSLKLAGSLSGSNSATVRLYQTKLAVAASTNLQLIYKSTAAGFTATRLLLYFTDDLANPVRYDIGSGSLPAGQWHSQDISLSAQQGRELAILAVEATSPTPVAAYQINLGRLRIVNGSTAPTGRPTVSFSASATTVVTNQPVTFANSSLNAASYQWTFAGATPASSPAVHPTVSYATAGTYAVKLRAENAFGRDSLTRTAYITVVNPASPGGNTSLLFDGVGKYVDAGAINLSGPGLSFECWVKPASFKTGSPFISSIVGIEDGGSNVALLRLGDAGLSGDQLQFVLNINGATRKLASVSRLSVNTWYHLAATYDGSAMRIYVNGVLDATLNATGSVIANAPFSVGRNYANSRVFDGNIDEVRVWKRTLSAAEIGANLCVVSASAPSLEGYWPFNEATGSVAVDATGHGHLGTLVNMTASDWSPLVPSQCATISAVSPGRNLPELKVYVLGNPVRGSQAELEVHGAPGQPIHLQLFNTLGMLVGEKQLQPAAGIARPSLLMPPAAGLYVLRVSTPRGSTSVKLLRQ